MKEVLDGTIKTAIFDMDGTVYQLDGDNGGFKNSSLHKNVKENTLKFFSNKENITKDNAQKIIDEINARKVFPSTFAAERYGITRKDFFDIVWNIDPNQIIHNFEEAVLVLRELSKKNIELILLSQAPKVWQNKVFSFLEIDGLFTEIYTGENYLHKTEMFPKFSQTRHPKTILAVGDQVETDILPASHEGYYTFLVQSPKDLLKLIQDE